MKTIKITAIAAALSFLFVTNVIGCMSNESVATYKEINDSASNESSSSESQENSDKSQKNIEKLEAVTLEKQDITGLSYDIVNKEGYDNNILFQNKYTDLEGVISFRGNNYRNSASYGVSTITEKTLSQKFKFDTSSSSWGGGAGWTGQPMIVKWPDELKNSMNIYDEFKGKEDFTEVIYSSLDGNIYFFDLESGKLSRDKIKVGNPIKGTMSIDSRGIPLLYIGEGIPEKDTVGFNIYSLIDGSHLYEINGMDEDAYRGWPAFDGSCLVCSDCDTVIEGGENGLIYIIKLNTDYDKDNNKITINPAVTKYRYGIEGSAGRLGIENSVAAYANLIYFADNNGDIQCVDLNTLEPVWMLRSGDDTDASLTIETEDGVPYVYTGTEVDHQGTHGLSTLRKINGFTGKVVWEKSFECDSIIGSDAVNGGLMATNVIGKNKMDDRVIFSLARYKGFNKGATIALDKNSGEIIWEHDFDNYMWSSPVDFYDEEGRGYLIQCDSIGNMFLLDGDSGEVLNKILLNGNVESSPAIYDDSIVVATRSGSIYGIDIK
ncbi:PQQ-binding-like beta-propeller repeat protein [uncultured Clostridium sp.]|uniref:outer membrane protein assembly factor BamB family protein n=1 Tax=uncultured Clostridium sp. TaxID=59620 RepID=UPI0025D6F4B4|nr:PQQ-binding-like beta-propeller repeat protein [uncultured Clostridium sp.]